MDRPMVGGLSVMTLLGGLGDGVLLNDPDGRILYANPALAAMLGFEDHELIGRTIFDLTDDAGRHAMAERLERRRRGVRERFDFHLVHRDGSIVWVLVAAHPAKAPDGTHLGSIVSLTDITEHKRLQADLQQMRERLEERVAARTAELEHANRRLELEVVERMTAEDAARWASMQKSRFLASISHELRTPLNAIIGYTELVLDDREVTIDAAVPDLERVLSSARHLLELINDILDLSKVEAGHVDVTVDEVDLVELVEEVADLMRGRVEASGNRFEVSVPDGRVLHATDARKVKQILFNLVSNAARFTRDGRIGVVLEADGPQVHIDDTGVGIAPADQARVFESFVQVGVPGLSQGTGLGLAISRQYARRLGGDVTLTSTPGQGSRFTLGFHRPAESPAEVGRAADAHGADHGG